jgi:hypothetical protein
MEYLRVKNWEEFQHYKDRNPPWIKLHRALLDNYDFCKLADETKAHLMLIWIHASQNDGLVPHDSAFLENKLSCREIDLEVLIEKGFLLVEDDASDMLAPCLQDDTKSVRLEEKRREEKIYAAFAAFWDAYPRKKSKGDAEKAWKQIKPNEQLAEQILQAVERAKTSDGWLKDQGKFVPYPASWLRAKGWEDEDAAAGPKPWEV